MKFSKSTRARIVQVAMALLLLFVIGMQFASPVIDNPPATGEFDGPDSVATILERSCYNCHSNETKLAWYDKIAPVSWVVSTDVRKARKAYNFSHWDSLAPSDQLAKLWYMVNMAEQGKMPLPSYTAVNPSARLSEKEITTLKNYVVALSAQRFKTVPPKQSTAAATPLRKMPVSPNGIQYFDGYRNWKILASTNRFDNGTLRVVYGNDIAVKAVADNTIDPWPNGATLVKVVWNVQPADEHGIVRPANFNNVQIMVRDDKKYKDTAGWGFARFNTPELVSYGKTIDFAVECIRCHQLASANGFVFDIPTKTK